MTLHQELKIIRGVAKAEGDTASAEMGLTILDLMDAGAFTLEADGWQPQIASFEGVYAESTIVTGRTLLAGREQNITETVRLTAVADTYALLYERVKRLQKFAQDARRFWTDFSEIEPVFLKWHALGAPGPQYALIYNINSDVSYPDYAQTPRVDVTLTIEREPYWREIAPGAFPTRLSSATLDNDHAFYAGEESAKRKNYLDIDDVPGDAPALVMLSMTAVNGSTISNKRYLAHSARSKTVRNRTPSADIGTNIQRYNVLNAPAAFGGAGGLLGSDTSLVADTGGVMQKGASTTRYRVECNFAATTSERGRLTWSSADGGFAAIQTFDWTRHQGRYAVFVRMRQYGGSFGDITVRVGLGGGETGNLLLVSTGQTVSPEVIGTNGNTVYWPLTYAGVIDIPPVTKAGFVRSDGLGLGAGTGASSSGAQNFSLHAARSTGAGVLYICDVVLMPIDTWMLSADVRINIDNTGYFAHGQAQPAIIPGMATGSPSTFDANFALPEVRGPSPYLLPGSNRLYGIYFAEDQANATATWNLSVRYVPRWRGVRDA